MEKVAHGIYILDDVWSDELFVLQERNKSIIYSGETALYLHGLGKSPDNTQPPGYYAQYITIKRLPINPKGYPIPLISYIIKHLYLR